MTDEEKELAVRLFELRWSEVKFEGSYNDALNCVSAAKAIYEAIAAIDASDNEEYERRNEAEIEEELERIRERKAKNRMKRLDDEKKTVYYLMFSHVCIDNGIDVYKAYIKSSIVNVDRLMNSIFTAKTSYMRVDVGAYKISNDDADMLLSRYKKRRIFATDRTLVCSSVDDFMRYVSECESAERIDLSGYNIGNANVL